MLLFIEQFMVSILMAVPLVQCFHVFKRCYYKGTFLSTCLFVSYCNSDTLSSLQEFVRSPEIQCGQVQHTVIFTTVHILQLFRIIFSIVLLSSKKEFIYMLIKMGQEYSGYSQNIPFLGGCQHLEQQPRFPQPFHDTLRLQERCWLSDTLLETLLHLSGHRTMPGLYCRY